MQEPTVMTKKQGADPHAGRMLDDDRTWFAANSGRVYRSRGRVLGDMKAGETWRRGDMTMVRTIGLLANGDAVRIQMPYTHRPGDDTSTDTGCARIWRREAEHAPQFAEDLLRRFAALTLALANASGDEA